ncbi:MAG TPA: zinc ribbon domain-containing protein [Armatimonadetes bacterium]|jgi:putative FmdB family regulatory protein|nr:zinc ribbon domain-containing protein [Armatimonadota bacterium]
MPIYEYRCVGCNRKFSHLHGMVANEAPLQCPRCGGTELKRLISRVSRARSEEEMFDALDPANFGDMEDAADVRRWARALGKEMGEELGEDFEESLDEMIEAEERGELSDEGGGEDAPVPPAPAASSDGL